MSAAQDRLRECRTSARSLTVRVGRPGVGVDVQRGRVVRVRAEHGRAAAGGLELPVREVGGLAPPDAAALGHVAPDEDDVLAQAGVPGPRGLGVVGVLDRAVRVLSGDLAPRQPVRRALDGVGAGHLPPFRGRRRGVAVEEHGYLGETGPLSQGFQARRKALRMRHINSMEVRKKRPRGFKKRPMGVQVSPLNPLSVAS